jgi:uncharacterized protein Yka (UPF0111/DUF47 family)
LLNSKITIKKTFEISENSSDEVKRKILKEIFTDEEIQDIWNGLASWASYNQFEENPKEAKKYRKISQVFYP